MKKIFLKTIFILFVTLIFQSCDKDITDQPVASVVNSINLSSPSAGASLTLNPNFFNQPTFSIKWSSADFGYAASVKYVLQIIKSTDSFSDTAVVPQILPLGTFAENTNSVHEAFLITTELNSKLRALGTADGTIGNFKMRVYAQPSAQIATAYNGVRCYSQEVSFTANAYDPLDETPKIYVYGNFGATSTYANWDINTSGTSNSPLIYNPALDGKEYNGFVFMNIANPQFKFANPTTTDLGIKGLGTAPVGSTPGTLVSSTDVSTGNVISAPAPAAAGTYYLTANWATNTYTIIPRKISIKVPNIAAQVLTYNTNPASPFYRMYVNTNTTLNLGSGYIQLKDFSTTAADRMGITDPSSPNLLISPTASSTVKNKMLYGNSNSFTITAPGNYTVVLDLRNSADYSLRAIPN